MRRPDRLAALALVAAAVLGACSDDGGGKAIVGGDATPGAAPTTTDAPTAAATPGTGEGAATPPPSSGPAFAPAPLERGGSRALPLSVGVRALVGSEWEVELVGYDPDATAEVLAFNSGNQPPPEGEVMAVARIRATYVGPDESSNAFLGLEWALVDDAGELHTDADCGVLPDDLASQSGVPRDGTAEGTICFAVPEDLLDQVVLFLAPLLGDPGTRVWWVAPSDGAGRVLQG